MQHSINVINFDGHNILVLNRDVQVYEKKPGYISQPFNFSLFQMHRTNIKIKRFTIFFLNGSIWTWYLSRNVLQNFLFGLKLLYVEILSYSFQKEFFTILKILEALHKSLSPENGIIFHQIQSLCIEWLQDRCVVRKLGKGALDHSGELL